jgi:hypothetical protein
MSRLWVAFVLGQLVGLLGWVDVLFIPLVLLGPLVVGGFAAAKGLPVTWPAVFWLSAGFNMLWTDWVVNREDVVFHLGVAVVTALLAAAAWAVTSLVSRRRASTA